MILICTPGSFSRLGEDDWVHFEIDWWLDHRRETAPILVETTDEGGRWVPRSVAARWPFAQRVPLSLDAWENLEKEDRYEKETASLNKIVAGLQASAAEVQDEERTGPGKRLDQPRQERIARAVDPVQILEQEHHRLVLAECVEQTARNRCGRACCAGCRPSPSSTPSCGR